MTCTTMDADQLLATADERQNIAGLDNVMSVLHLSPL